MVIFYLKTIIMILIISLVMSMMPVSVSAVTNNYETENNNTISKADVTYDDYNNYGNLPDPLDVDWWSFTAPRTGMANIWLGNIPEDCDFDMALFTSNGEMLAESSNGFDDNEFIKCRVTAGNNYRVKITSFSNYTTYTDAYYLFRIKLYDFNEFRIFAYDCTDIDTTRDIDVSLPYLYSLGYPGQGYLNNTVGPVYGTIPYSGIVVITHHGEAGKMTLNNSYLCAKAYSGMPDNHKAISSYSRNALSNVYLILFFGCETGNTHNTFGNLVDQAHNKGAFVCIGWKDVTGVVPSTRWLEEFWYQCTQTQNVYHALLDTDNWASQTLLSSDYLQLKKRYDGDCQTANLIL